ncbi:MAG TPA: hypothetical protein VM428_09225 [Microlunatus sp.]|nr:hypothetical protein [Microlunatus sp.]
MADLQHLGGARQRVEDLVERSGGQQVLAVDPGQQPGPLGQLRQTDAAPGWRSPGHVLVVDGHG